MNGQQHRLIISERDHCSVLYENIALDRPDPYWLPSADLALLVYDITDRKSFEWVVPYAKRATSVALVGTKEDYSFLRVVASEVSGYCTCKTH